MTFAHDPMGVLLVIVAVATIAWALRLAGAVVASFVALLRVLVAGLFAVAVLGGAVGLLIAVMLLG